MSLTELTKFVESEEYQLLYETLRGRYIKEFEHSATDAYAQRQAAFTKLAALRDLDKEIRVLIANLRLNNRG